MNVEWQTRLCKEKNRTGYFHCWEHYSKPFEASPFVGGYPAGIFSKVFGIVEFSDGVERVDPAFIRFCDEENTFLKMFDEEEKKQ